LPVRIVTDDRAKLVDRPRELASKGKLDKAIAEYEKVVAADPGDARSWLALADLHVKQGSVDEAAAAYREVATAYHRDGMYLKAIAVYKQILVIVPADGDAQAKLAALHRELGLDA
jgi:cytochrome c-type biogenesis protein CcmH/NrfG